MGGGEGEGEGRGAGLGAGRLGPLQKWYTLALSARLPACVTREAPQASPANHASDALLGVGPEAGTFIEAQRHCLCPPKAPAPHVLALNSKLCH